MPEAQIILSQAVTYVASAPKSNAANAAIERAGSVVQETRTFPIPVYLQDAHYKGAAKLGHGMGYQYPHDFPKHYVKQQYLPDGLADRKFYEPTEMGYEKQIKAHLEDLHEGE
jgi:putative ATPase